MPTTGKPLVVSLDGVEHEGRYITTKAGRCGQAIEVSVSFRGRTASATFPVQADQPGYAEVVARPLLRGLVEAAGGPS